MSYFFFTKPSNILNTPTTETFTTYFITPIVSFLAPNFGPVTTFLTFMTAPIITTQASLSNIEAYKGGIKLSIFSPKSIIIMYSKTFLKTEDLAYFSKIKKYSKV